MNLQIIFHLIMHMIGYNLLLDSNYTSISVQTKSSIPFNQQHIITLRNHHGDTLLHYACQKNLYEKSIFLHNRMPSLLSEPNIYGRIPIFDACVHNNLLLVQHLITQETCNHQDHNGTSLLHIACRYGYLELAQFLINFGIKTNLRNNQEETALHIACKNNFPQIIDLLVQHNVLLTTLYDTHKEYPYRYCKFNSFYHNLLEELCYLITKNLQGHKFITKEINLKTFINDLRDKQGNSPLHTLSKHYILDFLTPLDVSPDLKNNRHQTPLHTLAIKSDTHLFEYFLKKKLINIEYKDNQGLSVFHEACIRNDIQKAKLLVSYGASINTQDNKKNSPLISAIQANADKCVEFLLTLPHLTINLQNSEKNTALHYAFILQNTTYISLLLKKNASTTLKNRDGETPPLALWYISNPHIIPLILKYNIAINEQCKTTGDTLMHRTDNVDDILLLLEHGANLNLANKNGVSVYVHIKNILQKNVNFHKINIKNKIEKFIS